MAAVRWTALTLGLCVCNLAWAECEGVLEGEVMDAEAQTPLEGARILVPEQVRVTESLRRAFVTTKIGPRDHLETG